MNKTLNNVSKVFALVLALVMVLGVAIPAFAAADVTALEAAITEAENVQKGVAKSVDGTDVPTDQEWAKEEDFTDLNDAISNAQEVVNNKATAVQSDVDAAVDTLQTAIETFEDATSPGSKAPASTTNSTLKFINMDGSVEFNRDQIRDMLQRQAIEVVLEKADGTTVADAVRNLRTVIDAENDAWGELAFYLNDADIEAGDRLVVRYRPEDRTNAEGYSTKVIYTFEKDGTPAPGRDYRFQSDFNYNKDDCFLQVTSEGTPLAGVGFTVAIYDNNDKLVKTIVADTKAQVATTDYPSTQEDVRRTNYHGYFDMAPYFSHKTGKTVEELIEEGLLGKAINGEFYVHAIDGSTNKTLLQPGQYVRFTPIESDVKAADVANVKYDADKVFEVRPVFKLAQACCDEVKNYTVAFDCPANASINYGKVTKTVRIRAFSEDTPGKQDPVIGSTFTIYNADRDEKLNMVLGSKVVSAKTDENGYVEFELPAEMTQGVFNGFGYQMIEVPYLIVQEDGGVDKTVRPLDGFINPAGYYDENGYKTATGTYEISTIDDIISVQVRNNRDEAYRVDGDDIFGSAVEIAKDMYPNGVKEVVIATANDNKLADALTAGSIAGLYDAPLLLVDGEMTKEVEDYLKDPNNDLERIIVVGGPETVSDKLVTEFEEIAGKVVRISGANRWETATEAAKRVVKETGADTVLLANGEGNDKFVDALTASAVAAEYGYPVVLTAAEWLPQETADFLSDLDVEEVYVIGGENSVSEAVVRKVNALLESGTTVDRIAGENRFETAVAVAKKFFADAEEAVFVNGDNNQLVLVAGPLAAKNDGPIILVGKDVPESVVDYLENSDIDYGVIVGGVESTTEEVRLELGKLFRK